MTPLRKRFLEDLELRALSENTQRAYVRAIAQFALFFGKSPEELGREEIRTYLLYLVRQKRVSKSTYRPWVSMRKLTPCSARSRESDGARSSTTHVICIGCLANTLARKGPERSARDYSASEFEASHSPSCGSVFLSVTWVGAGSAALCPGLGQLDISPGICYTCE